LASPSTPIQRATAVSHRYIHFGVEIFSNAFESPVFSSDS
jgi:hypothetical protein